jgi:hypothetical protein
MGCRKCHLHCLLNHKKMFSDSEFFEGMAGNQCLCKKCQMPETVFWPKNADQFLANNLHDFYRNDPYWVCICGSKVKNLQKTHAIVNCEKCGSSIEKAAKAGNQLCICCRVSKSSITNVDQCVSHPGKFSCWWYQNSCNFFLKLFIFFFILF